MLIFSPVTPWGQNGYTKPGKQRRIIMHGVTSTPPFLHRTEFFLWFLTGFYFTAISVMPVNMSATETQLTFGSAPSPNATAFDHWLPTKSQLGRSQCKIPRGTSGVVKNFLSFLRYLRRLRGKNGQMMCPRQIQEWHEVSPKDERRLNLSPAFVSSLYFFKNVLLFWSCSERCHWGPDQDYCNRGRSRPSQVTPPGARSFSLPRLRCGGTRAALICPDQHQKSWPCDSWRTQSLLTTLPSMSFLLRLSLHPPIMTPDRCSILGLDDHQWSLLPFCGTL